ncbi:MAG: VCBS repeat-containing protein [Cyclobacteriaceae bacterium]|nr:VCBS repeat-containing protein [Cyclobacteriaceae bacterium]
MGSTQHISQLFKKKLNQWENHKLQVENDIHTGRFYRFRSAKRFSLLNKLQRLTRRLNNLRCQMKLAALGGTAAALANTQDAVAQSTLGPFIQQPRALNPLRQPMKGLELKPTSVDLDNDGDYDFVVGQQYGTIKIYLNEGTSGSPAFVEYEALDENLDPIYGYGGAPAFADLNGDGDLDMAFGTHGASVDRIRYFVGNGGIPGSNSNPLFFTEQDGPWVAATKMGNPFYGSEFNLVGANITPTFVNIDGDGDLDLLVGSNYQGTGTFSINYFINDGQSNFTHVDQGDSPFPFITFSDNNRSAPQLVDVDGDGNLDLITGRYYGDLRFFKGDGSSFTEQTGPWDANAKTGSPFDGLDFGLQSAPTFVDLDNDSDFDLVLGMNKYGLHALLYLENKGNAVFERKLDLENPFDGLDVGLEAAPFLVDLDGDGDLDAVVGADDQSYDLFVYRNENGVFIKDTDHSIADIDILRDNYKPIFVDIDGDTDQDLFVALDDEIIFYRNNAGIFESESSPIDISGLIPGSEYSLAFLDIDDDGDWDAFLGNDGNSPNPSLVQFMVNEGSKEEPDFTVATAPTPFDTQTFNHTPNVFSTDIDHDGDLDLIVAESIEITLPYYTVFRLFVNNADQTFTEGTLPISTPQKISRHSYLSMADVDSDGDLDIFVGYGADLYVYEGGTVEFFENQNPAPTTTLNNSVLEYAFDGVALAIDAALTLADTDGDDIVQATVSIQNYQPGNETLAFTPESPVTGNFDNSTGVLTLQGSAPLSVYQSVLRSVTYEYTGPDPGARKGGRTKAISKTITFQTLDADLTAPTSASRTVNISSATVNQPPAISAITLSTVVQGSVSIDLAPLISDSESNFDPNITGAISIVSQPQSGASTSLSGTVLTIDYTGLSFTGNETMQVQICDIANACTTVTINISVAGEIIVRNGISPNADGLNDYFRLDNIEAIGPENKVSIFNRWGDKVFEIDNYDNQNRRFEGKSDSGKELSSGVYFYKIEFSNGLSELKGYLTLKR